MSPYTRRPRTGLDVRCDGAVECAFNNRSSRDRTVLPNRRQVVVVGAHAQSLWLRVERVPKEGETVLGWGYEEPLDGGKATNQAVAAAKLGVPVSFVSMFGDDERGERIRRYLLDEGVDLSYAVIVHGPTDVGFNILPKSGVPAIVTASDKSCLLDKATVELAAPALRTASCVLAQLEAPPEVALAAFDVAHASGALTVLNPAPAADLDGRPPRANRRPGPK